MSPTHEDAIKCCGLLIDLYKTYDEWEASGKPAEFEKKSRSLLWTTASSFLRKPGPRDRYEWVHERSPMVRLLIDNRTLYVVIRGTSTSHEWSNNFRFIPRHFSVRDKAKEFSFGGVHDGFADIYDSLNKELIEKLNYTLTRPGNFIDRVIFTGHSLGAAVATLAYAVFLYRFSQMAFRTMGIMFGSPRVGNPSFGRTFYGIGLPEAFVRYEMLHDPVVETPPVQIALWQFRHVGQSRALRVNYGSNAANHVMPSYLKALTENPP